MFSLSSSPPLLLSSSLEFEYDKARELQVWDALVELCLAAGDSEEEWLPVQAKDIVSKLYTNTPPERLWMAEVRAKRRVVG